MTLNEGIILKFARGYRLQHDRVRDLWLIQAPEKAFIVEGAAPYILGLVDGKNNIKEITQILSEKFSASEDVISKDVFSLLTDLVDKGVLIVCH